MANGYDCEFVDEPPKELHSECSICLMVLRQPYLVDCCGHHFCKACLEGVSEVKKVCPLCKHESFTAIPNKGLERVLNERKVYCTNKKAGCDWSGELRQLDSHLVPLLSTSVLDGCQFVEVRCQNCPVMVKRIEMKKHLDECPNRPILCQHCKNYSASQRDHVENHLPVCPKFPVSCPNKCGASIQRKNVTKHVDTACPLSKLQCEYSHVGCKVVMTRKKMDAHLKSVSGMADHLSLMDKAYSDLKKSKSEKKVEDEEKDKLRMQVKDLESELALMEGSYQSQLASLEERKVALKKKIRRQRNVIEQLTSENRNLTAKLDIYYGRVGKRPGHKSTSTLPVVSFGHGSWKVTNPTPKSTSTLPVVSFGHGSLKVTNPTPKSTSTLPVVSLGHGSWKVTNPTPKSSGSRKKKKSADSDEKDGIGWGTALSLAAGIGLGVVGAAGVAAMALTSSSDKDKKSKTSS